MYKLQFIIIVLGSFCCAKYGQNCPCYSKVNITLGGGGGVDEGALIKKGHIIMKIMIFDHL